MLNTKTSAKGRPVFTFSSLSPRQLHSSLLPTIELEHLKRKILIMVLNHHTNSLLCTLMNI